MTQPALTQAINILEQAASVQLMIRSREGVELTQAGKLFYESVLRILAEADSLALQLNATHDRHKLRMRIGIFESIAIYAWPSVQEQMRRAMRPFLRESEVQSFELQTGRTEWLLERLNVGELDIAIVVDPETRHTQKSDLLFEDNFYLYCSTKEQEIKVFEHKNKTPKATMRPLFLFENAKVNKKDNLQSIFLTSQIGTKFNFDVVNKVDSFEVATEFVRAGLGFALLPERVALRQPKGLYKLKPDGKDQVPIASHGVFAVAPRTTAMSLQYKMLCEAFRLVQ